MKKNAWIYKVFLLTFILSVLFSTITDLIAYRTNQVIIFIVLIIVIIISIVFDMIGTAALTADEKTFHAMNAQKLKGAKEAIFLIKNNVQVANICNDVIGDICGVISGGLGTVLAISLSNTTDYPLTMTSILLAAFISALIVGGKAIFKNVAINNAANIIYQLGRLKCVIRLKK